MNKLIAPAFFTAIAGFSVAPAHAGLIDFADMANSATGESAWDTFTYSDPDGFTLSVVGELNGGSAFAYLDSGTGGMGVCGQLSSTGVSYLNQETNSTNNLCDPSSDDDVTVGESLVLTFDQDVQIDTLWFNNFHDGDESLLGDTIDIFGNAYTFTNGDSSTPSFTTTPYIVTAGTEFTISYNSEQFYLQKLNVTLLPPPDPDPAPAPATLFLSVLGLGMLGLGRRKRASKA